MKRRGGSGFEYYSTTKRGVRYRYYISAALVIDSRSNNPTGVRVPADALEAIVENEIQVFLSDEHLIYAALSAHCADEGACQVTSKHVAEWGRKWPKLSPDLKRLVALTIVDRVVVKRGSIEVGILSKRLPQPLALRRPGVRFQMTF